LTAGVDVQDDRIELEVVGWGANEESWSIEFVTVPGNPALPEVWENLDIALAKTYTHEYGVELRIVCALVDSGGHFTKEAYAFCQSRNSRWIIASKGIAGGGKPLAGKLHKLRTGALLCPVGVDTAKELLWARLRMVEAGPGYCHFPRRPEHNEEYFAQLTAEKMTTKYHHGFPVKVWIKTRPRNEALDCRVYAMAALDLRRVDLKAALANLKKRAEYVEPEPEPEIVGSRPPEPPNRPVIRPKVTHNTFATNWRR
jgi:phage terminase large subunit GpA-like protein